MGNGQTQKQVFVICCAEKYTKPEMEGFRRKFKKALDDLKQGKDGIVVYPHDVYVNPVYVEMPVCGENVQCTNTPV